MKVRLGILTLLLVGLIAGLPTLSAIESAMTNSPEPDLSGPREFLIQYRPLLIDHPIKKEETEVKVLNSEIEEEKSKDASNEFFGALSGAIISTAALEIDRTLIYFGHYEFYPVGNSTGQFLILLGAIIGFLVAYSTRLRTRAE